MLKLILAFQLCCICILYSNAQNGAANPAKRPHDWWQADWKKDSIPGISLGQAYEYLQGRKSKTVIVAIIDNCIDTAHEELKDFIWANKKEIPGNGIDDDHNGYIDDVHGWCFIANTNSVIQEKQSSGEIGLYKDWKNRFENIDTTKLNDEEKIEYDWYVSAKKTLAEKWKIYELASQLPIDSVTLTMDSARFVNYLDNLCKNYGNKFLYDVPFASLSFSDRYDSILNQLFLLIITKDKNWEETVTDFDKDNKTIPGFVQGFGQFILWDKYKYADTTTNFRQMLGDDPQNFKDLYYGTPSINLKQIGGKHATPIAGIIGANRYNNKGIKGIADNVMLMPLVTLVPNGGFDEKDVYAAIHYAVDNGAFIINISGRSDISFSENIKEMKEAFDYADQHHVLIIQGAGNNGKNLDSEKYFIGQGLNGNEHDTYLRVGATTALMNDSLVAAFSDFSKKRVDLFAPGVAIFSTEPGNQYGNFGGTSAACPIVVGVAALLKSYFPTLTAEQVKEILVKSVYKPSVMVLPPIHAGFTNKISFSLLSKSGGIVNAYNAVRLAAEMTRKKK
ncbi:MAG: S8 family serine peptidase [Ginsengibacter sp.]